MASKIGNFLLARDTLGYPFQVFYKGKASHETIVGAIVSICIKVLVLTQLIQKTISLVNMTEPTIQSYVRPIYEHEANELGKLNLSENNFNFGVFFTSSGNPQPIEIPESVGRVIMS